LKSKNEGIFGFFGIACYMKKNDEEFAFHLTLNRSALNNLSVGIGFEGECEVSGILGKIQEVRVCDDSLIEIRGTFGVIRISLPHELLKVFALRQKEMISQKSPKNMR
jgi:hypothetical protein